MLSLPGVALDRVIVMGARPNKRESLARGIENTWNQEALLTIGVGWAAVSVGPLQERSSRDAQMMLTSKITQRNMARRITERERKIKHAKTVIKDFLASSPVSLTL